MLPAAKLESVIDLSFHHVFLNNDLSFPSN